jgi:hypothetical protein
MNEVHEMFSSFMTMIVSVVKRIQRDKEREREKERRERKRLLVEVPSIRSPSVGGIGEAAPLVCGMLNV